MIKSYKMRKRRGLTGWENQLKTCIVVLILSPLVFGQSCPWEKDEQISGLLSPHCICVQNPSDPRLLSIQCEQVDGYYLLAKLSQLLPKASPPLEFLHLNASRVTDPEGLIPSKLFSQIKLTSLQLSHCDISSIHHDAFLGQESTLKHLSLANNLLTKVPRQALQRLSKLALLDLGYNLLTRVGPNSFRGLRELFTLKLNDNSLQLNPHAFRGLQRSLKNLNLKGTRISSFPIAITNLTELTFLDLAQNRIRELEPKALSGLKSLTALNLERNLLQSLPPHIFNQVENTLSSVSLLNNLITTFPMEALHSLKELRVLDLGFNLITEIPKGAFRGLHKLTLLALDGNPLTTLPYEEFENLNSTLRGLSLGGRFLSCDCRLRWILQWIQKYELQVTSRERNPKFCGSPATLRDMNLFEIQYDDLQCLKNQSKPEVHEFHEEIALTSNIDTFSTSEENTQVPEAPETTMIPSSTSTTSTTEDPTTITKTRHNLKPNRRRKPFRRKIIQIVRNVDTTNQSVTELPPSVNISTTHKVRRVQSLPTTQHAMSTTTSASTTTTTVIPLVVVNITTTSTTEEPKLTSEEPSSNPRVRFPHMRFPPQRRRPVVEHENNDNSPRSSIRAETTKLDNTTPLSTIVTAATSTKTPVILPSPSFIEKQQERREPPPLQPKRMSKSNDDLVEQHNAGFILPSAVGTPRKTGENKGSAIPVSGAEAAAEIQKNLLDTKSEATNLYSQSTSVHSRPPNLIFASDKMNISIKELERTGSSVSLKWDSTAARVSGFRIIYRRFGDDTFSQGPPLAATEREYTIRNVPHNECVIVCVAPYEDTVYNEIYTTSATSLPPKTQCRELKPLPVSAFMNHMDKITIGASAAICATVILAVLIFVGLTKRAKNKSSFSSAITKMSPSTVSEPSPGPLGNMPASLRCSKDWDEGSAESTQSIPRARIMQGTMDNCKYNPTPSMPHFTSNRYYQNNQDHATARSYLSRHHAHHNHSMHGFPHSGSNGNLVQAVSSSAVNSYLNNQSRLLRASMGSRSSQDALNKQLGPSSQIQRHFEQHHHGHHHQKRRRGRGMSHSESLNTLSGYETPDNWTDHDMEVYVASNETKNNLMQL